MNKFHKKRKKRYSPRATIVLSGWREGQHYNVTEYDGSSLKGGAAFMHALQKAQTDQSVENVYYFEKKKIVKDDGTFETVSEEVIVPIRKVSV